MTAASELLRKKLRGSTSTAPTEPTEPAEETASDYIPAALTGYVCPGLLSDNPGTPMKGWIHCGYESKEGIACFVIPQKKYKAWSAFLPKTAGRNIIYAGDE